MFVRDLILSCLRRWYLLVAGLLLTGLGTFAVFTAVPATYEAQTSMVLVPPQVAITTGDNPFLYLGGLDQALGVLQVKVTAPEVIGSLLDKNDGAEITVSQDATTSGPILVVSISGNDEGTTMGLLRNMLAVVPQTLAQLQSELDVPKRSAITLLTLSVDKQPTAVTKRRTQLTAAAGVGGAGATLLLVGFLDGVLSRRTNRKKAAGEIKVGVSEQGPDHGGSDHARTSSRGTKRRLNQAERANSQQDSVAANLKQGS